MSQDHGGPERLPPQSREAERSVLGSMLRDNGVIGDVIQIVRTESFYFDAHQKIFEAMTKGLYDKGHPVDLVTLAEYLKEQKHLEDVGNYAYLAELWDAAPTAANAEYYARIVRDKAIVRHLIHASTEVLRDAYDQAQPADELLEGAERRILDIAQMGVTGQTYTLEEALRQAYDRIDTRHQHDEFAISGLSTGFVDLDDKTAGLQNSELVIIAARPSCGKTAFSLNLVRHIAVEDGHPVFFVSLEQSRIELAERLLCCQARVDSHRLRKGTLSSDDMQKLIDAGGILSKARLFIDDTPGQGMLRIAANARRLKLRHGIKLVVVDYLQLIEPDNRRDSRQEQVAQLSRRLKFLARELQIPVIALAQVNRSSEDRQDHRPRLADLRECVTGNTLVLLADGRRVPIRALVGSQPNVLAVSHEGRIVSATAECVWSVGQRPVFEVRLASGRSLRATARHRLLTACGWERVEALRTGDRLAIARSLPAPARPTHWPERQLILLAHLIGDGSYLSHQPLRYTTSSEENSAAVAEAARGEFDVRVSRHAGRGAWHQLVFSGNGNRWHPAGINLWLRELGLYGQHSFEKRLPGEVFQLANPQIALLLRHLWATDGCIGVRSRGTRGAHRIYFSTNSLGLAHDVSALLLRFGIVARLKKVLKGAYRPTYTVDVSGASDQRRFLDEIGAFGPRRKPAQELASRLAGQRVNTNVDTLPQEVFQRVRRRMAEQGISWRKMAALRGTAFGGIAHFNFAPSRAVGLEYAELLDDDVLRQQATSDLFWDTIASITPAGEEEVFDLTVPGPSSWLADGIVSHNSGAIEQDADTVLLLHRPELFEPGQHEGILEVIIAKQRNGPTGEVTLTFLKQFMRFENFAVASPFGIEA